MRTGRNWRTVRMGGLGGLEALGGLGRLGGLGILVHVRCGNNDHGAFLVVILVKFVGRN